MAIDDVRWAQKKWKLINNLYFHNVRVLGMAISISIAEAKFEDILLANAFLIDAFIKISVCF